MWVYVTGCLLSVFMTGFASEVQYKKECARHTFLVAFFSSLPLIFIASIRYNVGKDYPNYMRLFLEIGTNTNRVSVEPIYTLLNKFLYNLGFDFPVIFFATSFIFLIFTFCAIYNDSQGRKMSAYLLVCTGYYFTFMNGTRQLIACAILLWSIKFVKEKKIVPFVITVLVATGFHYSSILFLVTYFVGNFKFNKKIIFFLTALTFVFSSQIARICNNIILLTGYGGYVGGQFDVEAQGYTTLLITAAVFLFATIFYDDDTPEYSVYYNLQAIALVLAGLNGKVVLINRIRWIFGLPVIILIPMAIKNIKNENVRLLAKIAIVVLYGIYFYYTIGINNSNNVLPYQTIFNYR